MKTSSKTMVFKTESPFEKKNMWLQQQQKYLSKGGTRQRDGYLNQEHSFRLPLSRFQRPRLLSKKRR